MMGIYEPGSIRALHEMMDQVGTEVLDVMFVGIAAGMGILAALATVSLAMSVMATAFARLREARISRKKYY